MGCKGEVVKKLSDEEVGKLGEELAALPKGCIFQKRIRGKVTFYRQWTEGGKTRSQYLSVSSSFCSIRVSTTW